MDEPVIFRSEINLGRSRVKWKSATEGKDWKSGGSMHRKDKIGKWITCDRDGTEADVIRASRSRLS